jgi:hypothetical protein
MRAPGEGRSVSFRVHLHLDGAREGSVTIAPMPTGFLFTVRPKGRHHTYTLPLANVAEMVAARVAKIDAAQNGGRS